MNRRVAVGRGGAGEDPRRDVSGALAERRPVVEQRALSHAGLEAGLGRLFGVSGWMVVDKRR
jgi:hypothetical protein